MDKILKYFSEGIRNELRTENFSEIEEIRLRTSKPIIIKKSKGEIVKSYIVKTEDMMETLQLLCDNSIYSYQNQICNGYITINGGHRVGIAGTIIIEEGKIINMSYISSLNIRIAKQVIGCSDKLLSYLVTRQNSIFNTLIVSPPGEGKTTILRDFVRNISNLGKTVGVVDERGEIAAMYRGTAQNDLGIRTDVIENIPKAIGMKMLIRSMSPQVIVADEIGNKGDTEAIQYALCSGIKGVFTAHGNNIREIECNPEIGKLLKEHMVEKIVFLKNKNIEEIYELSKESLKYKKTVLNLDKLHII